MNFELYEPVPILGTGYVKLIEFWGSEERIIESARMSTDKGFLGWGPLPCDCLRNILSNEPVSIDDEPLSRYAYIDCKQCKGSGWAPGDEKLLKYLWEHKHFTPFEMAGFTIEVQAPIMVFREWHRHRTQSYNELSARYTPIPNDNYMPTVDRCLMVNVKNKQAGAIKGVEPLTHGKAIEWLEALADVYDQAQQVYQMGLDYGVPKELARLPVPVGRMTRMRASANLRNWLGFLTLRLPEDAQFEIRQFSNAILDLTASIFPRTYELFNANR